MKMGCGCQKSNTVQAPPAATIGEAVVAAQRTGNVRMFDVNDAEGTLIASYSNIVTARAEARRINGNVVPRDGAPV